jgi:hypothetical protein
MSDHGIVVSSGFRFGSKIRAILDFRHNVVARERRSQESARRITDTHSRDSNGYNKFQRDQFDTSFGTPTEKIGQWSMFNWFKRVPSENTEQLKTEFANLHKSSMEVKKALEPYLDAHDPLVALTLTLFSNKQKEIDRGKSHS